MYTDDGTWLRFRPPARISADCGPSPEPTTWNDEDLIARTVAAFRVNSDELYSPESFWLNSLAALKRASLDALASSDPQHAADHLRHPMENTLYYGFDEIFRPDEALRHGSSHVMRAASWLYDLLCRLGEAVGVQRLAYPEVLDAEPPPPVDVEALLASLDAEFGFRVLFPNPFGGEIGLSTSRGFATFRAIQSLYQAWRLKTLLGDSSEARILEIGAGSGRTCYYASHFGFESYDIVDIPLTNVAQANFLGRVLDSSRLLLHGEDGAGDIRIARPEYFLKQDRDYDLIVNFDGLTEMGRDIADAYWNKIQGRTPVFLSVNHEYNPFTMRELYQASGRTADRRPYWLRRGYVDEVIRF